VDGSFPGVCRHRDSCDVRPRGPRGTRRRRAVTAARGTRHRAGRAQDALRVAALDRAEELEHDLDVLVGAHDLSPFKSSSMTASYVAWISRST
jgi:hypothetical protein